MRNLPLGLCSEGYAPFSEGTKYAQTTQPHVVVSTVHSAKLITGISHTEKTLAAHPRLGKRAAELCLLFLTPPAVSLGRLSVASPTLRKGGTEAWRQGWLPNAEEVLGLDLNSDLLS